MKINVGDRVTIAKGSVIADYEVQDNLVILLTEGDSVIIYPGRAPPFFFTQKKIFFPPPYEDMEDESVPPKQYHMEKAVKIQDKQVAVKYRMQLSKTFDTDGAYYMVPLYQKGAPILNKRVQPTLLKPDEFSEWLQQDIDPKSFESEVLRLYTTNSGDIVYYDEVPEELAQTMRAALCTIDGGHMWWSPVRLLEKIGYYV